MASDEWPTIWPNYTDSGRSGRIYQRSTNAHYNGKRRPAESKPSKAQGGLHWYLLVKKVTCEGERVRIEVCGKKKDTVAMTWSLFSVSAPMFHNPLIISASEEIVAPEDYDHKHQKHCDWTRVPGQQDTTEIGKKKTITLAHWVNSAGDHVTSYWRLMNGKGFRTHKTYIYCLFSYPPSWCFGLSQVRYPLPHGCSDHKITENVRIFNERNETGPVKNEKPHCSSSC